MLQKSKIRSKNCIPKKDTPPQEKELCHTNSSKNCTKQRAIQNKCANLSRKTFKKTQHKFDNNNVCMYVCRYVNLRRVQFVLEPQGAWYQKLANINLSPLTSHLSHVTSQLPPFSSHPPPLTSDLSPLTSHLSLSPLTSHLDEAMTILLHSPYMSSSL